MTDYMVEDPTYAWLPWSETKFMQWPESMPQITFFIPRPNNVKYPVQSEFDASMGKWMKWMKWQRRHWSPVNTATTILQFMLFVAYSFGKWTQMETSWILSIYMLKYNELTPQLVTRLKWRQIRAKDLKSIDASSKREQHSWDIEMHDSTSSGQISKHFGYCFNYATLRKRYLSSSLEQRMSSLLDAHVHIVQLIMGNFTYEVQNVYSTPDDNTMPCKSPGVPDSIQTRRGMSESILFINLYAENGTKIIYWPSVVLNNSLTNIRFIACGTRGTANFSFGELVIVFDFPVWICLCAGICCLWGITVKLNRNKSFSMIQTSAIEIYKVFVEQGSPFPDEMITSVPFRFITIGTMLAGIVLSNAYKNHNVYKMTQPRKVISYDTVDELVSDKFTLYSRVGCVIFRPYSMLPHIVWKTPYAVSYMNQPLEHGYRQLKQTGVELDYYLESAQYGTGLAILNESHDNVIRPHPNAEKTIWMLYDNLIHQNIGTDTPSSHELHSQYMYLEHQWLVDEVRDCKKTAVFLPEVIALKFLKDAQLRKNCNHVTIGKQVFKRESVEIVFYGIVAPSVRERTNIIQESGLQQKWEKLFGFDEGVEFSPKNVEVKAAPLLGNILIIFVMALTGMLFSTIVFLFERCTPICSL